MKQNREDPRAYFFSSMVPFWEYFFGGNSDDSAREYLERSEKALEISQSRLKENPRDTAMVLFLSGFYGYRGLVAANEQQYNIAIKNGLAAYQYTRKMLKMDIDDTNALIGTGIFNYMMGNVPEKMRWVINFAGMDASRVEGLKLLKMAAGSDGYVSNDAMMMLTILYQKEERYREGLKHVRTLRRRYPQNIIFQYYYAQLLEQCERPSEARKQYQLVLEMPHRSLGNLKQKSLDRIKKL